MDFIKFEKVSIAEASCVLKGDKEPVKNEDDWEEKREAQIAHDLLLQESTCDWLASLPANIRPINLAKQFPRVANKIASVWARPLACDKVMDELMLDHRGKRAGFPVEVGSEIATLREYYNKEVYVLKHDIWTLA